MRERKAWLILHGKQALNEEVRAAVNGLRERGWDLAVRLTWEGGDAERLVGEGLAAGYPTLIAGGGDGTLRDVVEALVKAQSDASLALLPLGTANDFAHAAGIPLTPAAALALLECEPVAVDVGMAGERAFLNMATGGFGSNVTANTPEELKKVLGGAAYLLTGLSRFPKCARQPVVFMGRISNGRASFWLWVSVTGDRPVAGICFVRRRASTMVCSMSASCRRRRMSSAPWARCCQGAFLACRALRSARGCPGWRWKRWRAWT